MIMIGNLVSKISKGCTFGFLIASKPPKKSESPVTFWSWWESWIRNLWWHGDAVIFRIWWNMDEMHFPRGILGVGSQLLVLMVWPMVWNGWKVLEAGLTNGFWNFPSILGNSSVKNEKDTGDVLYSCLNSMLWHSRYSSVAYMWCMFRSAYTNSLYSKFLRCTWYRMMI